MTSNTSWFDKLFEVLNSAQTILKCPICLEKIIDPSQLTPCGHIFCQLCISKVYTISKNQPCSICNKLFNRRNIVSVKEQMAEYKDMLDRLIGQLSLDLGYDITSHIAGGSSNNKGFSSIRKNCTIKNNIDNVNREESKINQQDTNKNNISESKGEDLKMNKQNRNKSNPKISNTKEDNLKPNDHLELNLKPERKSSRRISTIEVIKSTNSPNLDKHFSKVGTQPSKSTVRTMTFNSESSGDESFLINQFSEEDLDIFVRKSIRTVTPRTKPIPIQNKIKSISKRKISKLKTNQNKDISHERELQGTVDKMKVDPSSSEIISATKSAMMKSTSFSESDLEDISDNGADLKTSMKKDLNCSPTNQETRNSKSESLINKMEEQNNKNGDKKKRKRLEKCIAQNTNIETNLESPLVKSPVRKRHCSDIGIQTSPSRLISLFNDTKTMFVTKETAQKQFINQPSITSFKSPIEKCMTNASPFNIVSFMYKTPVVSNIIQHHSTPILAMINENSINDISIQITQRNPKFNSDTECEENNLEENRHDLTVGNMKTPMMNKKFLPGNCSIQKFSVVSNPTTSERRRINDSKFLNDSIGIPGDSLLENSDLSSSILQNTVNSAIRTEHTPSTVHDKSKRVSRKLLDIFEDESDMFDTNNEEEVLDKSNNPSLLVVESERYIECPVTLDTKEHGKEIVQTDSQKLDIGSESSSKENKNPEVIQDLFSDNTESLESSSRNDTFLKEKNVLENIMSQKVVHSGSGILIVNNTPLSSEATVMNSQCDLIKKAADVIEDSDEDEEQCFIEASPEKLSQLMTQSITSGIYKTCEPKEFCFVTSSLLPSQLRYVKILAEVLGCRITGNVTHDTSHLIIQTCEKGRVKRTLKYLQAIVLHKIVVSYNWVTSSLEEKALLDVEPYIVCDTWGAKAVHRSLNNSGNYLLKNFAIAVVEPTLELTVRQIDELLDACGAIVIKDPRCFNFVPDKLLRVILTDKEDVGEEATGWLQKYKAVVLRVDWLVSTISQYEVISLNGYLQIPMTSEVLLGLGFPQELTEEDEDVAD